MKTFIAECQRRRVFRVAALYVVGVWIVLQVADLAFESWGIPSAALRYVWVGAIVGLPIALFLGWRFDIVGGRIRARDLDEELLWAGGLGLRYFSPIGPLRLDVAMPINGRDDVDDDFEFYISIGQAF